MKVRVLIMAMMAAFASFANAQEQKPVEEQQACQLDKRIEAHVARMNERFLLDDAKAEKFTQLYTAYLKEKAACRPQYVFGEKLTDVQLEANMETMLAVKEKASELDRKYYKKLSKLLNAKQLYLIFGHEIQRAEHPKAPGKGMHGMPPHRMGKPGAPKGKCPKDFKKRDCKKAPDCKKAVDCKKNVCCPKCEACPKAGECKMKADCRKECRLEGKCVAPKAVEVEAVVETEKAAEVAVEATVEAEKVVEAEKTVEAEVTVEAEKATENVTEAEKE